jgi:steroid 5-alpha reductase family enzyme
MPHPAWLLLAVPAVFLLLWRVQIRTRNAGWVDVAWAMGTGGVAALSVAGAEGWPPRQVAYAVLSVIWSLRLGGHIARRVHGRPEDTRYAALRSGAGKHAGAVFLAVYGLNAALVLLFSAAVAAAAAHPLPAWRMADAIGLALGVLALAGEAQADGQLRRFARDPARRAGVCRDGWWRYSRHPNYFFEWLFWFAFLPAGLATPHWPWALAAPAAMLFFLLRVTGIPATEAQSLRSRGEAYREYQRTTSAFVPWFPRRG